MVASGTPANHTDKGGRLRVHSVRTEREFAKLRCDSTDQFVPVIQLGLANKSHVWIPRAERWFVAVYFAGVEVELHLAGGRFGSIRRVNEIHLPAAAVVAANRPGRRFQTAGHS